MEWLSNEEKSRSMMPYLMDLPPLDGDKKATVTAYEETKEEQPKTKVSKKKSKEVDMDKWQHSSEDHDSLPGPQSPALAPTTTTTKFTFHLPDTLKVEIDFANRTLLLVDLTDAQMTLLRSLASNTKTQGQKRGRKGKSAWYKDTERVCPRPVRRRPTRLQQFNNFIKTFLWLIPLSVTIYLIYFLPERFFYFMTIDSNDDAGPDVKDQLLKEGVLDYHMSRDALVKLRQYDSYGEPEKKTPCV